MPGHPAFRILAQWRAPRRHRQNVREAVKDAVDFLNYPDLRSIGVNQIDTRSLRGRGANALHAAGFGDRQITKMGWRKSKTFIEYIHKELGYFSSGMSRA